MAGSRALLIEDSPTYSELATILLTAIGWTVVSATTAEEGLRLAQAHPPDLVLMDTNLPGMDGFEAVRKLRADPRTSHIPAVGLTGDTPSDDRELARAREAGFDAYLTKPIDKASFQAVLAPFCPPP
jgi:CheY-like chemotaxis protein